jgi:hypothetical protein
LSRADLPEDDSFFENEMKPEAEPWHRPAEVPAVFGGLEGWCSAQRARPSFEARKSGHLRMTTKPDAPIARV